MEPPGDAELETLLRRRVPLRTRLVQGGVVLLVVGVVIGVLIRQVTSLPGVSGKSAVSGPGPVVVVSNVSVDQVTLNGRMLTRSTPAVLPVRSGANTIIFSATSFLPRTCQLQWGPPGLLGTDCTAEGRDSLVTIGGRTIHPGLIIYFGLTDADLAPDQDGSAKAAVAHALAEQGGIAFPVAPGEYLATGGFWPFGLSYQRATMQVQAAISYGLFASQDQTLRPRDCSTVLCVGSLLLSTPAAGAAPIWQVSLDAYYRWSLVGTGQMSVAYPLQPSASLALTYNASLDGWQVAPESPAGNLSKLASGLAAGLCGTGVFVAKTLSQSTGQDGTQVLHDQQLDGCEIGLTTPQHTSAGRFIWRFGVLLAVDAAAHATASWLPIAPSQEVATVEG
jgi:hypothetical protein